MSLEVNSGKPSVEHLVSAYMQTVLETGIFPKSVYAFCKANQWEESDFYALYGSLESLRKGIWSAFFHQTLDRTQADEGYEAASLREKSLSFLFTFFELLGLNRSYVLLDLESGNSLKRLDRLAALRADLKKLAREWAQEEDSKPTGKLSGVRDAVFAEGMWAQFVFLLDFWRNDTSAGFEKTDLAIEKSVNTIFDLFDYTPLDRVIDFGKFLVRERFS